MYKYASSEVYSVTLTTKTPVFIGSGSTIGKKEFFVDRNKIHVLDMDAVMKAVFQNGLINDFQNLMLSNNYSSTHEFLKSFFTDTEIKEMIRYSCQCTDVFSYGKPPTEIQQFWHTPDNHPYIPGSSVKGAIRTCLIGAELLDEQPVKYSEIKDRIHKLENKYNNIMRYLSVSDSEPLAPTDLTLCKKYDVNTLGTAKPLNLVRECIAPGKKLKFKITIDCSDNVLTLKTLQYAIKRFSEFYTDMTKNCYDLPDNCGVFTYDNNLILGGGCGYLSKTVVYEAAEYDEALEFTANFMMDKFKNKHNHDIEDGVSPHTLKYTKYSGLFYPFGICSPEFK